MAALDAQQLQQDSLKDEKDGVPDAHEDGNGAAVEDTKEAADPLQSTQSSAQAGNPDEITNPFFLDKDGKPRKRQGLPPLLDHFNAKDLKHLVKAVIPLWTFFLFIPIDPLLNVYGTATFIGCIMLLIAPATGIFFIQFLMAMSILVGMGLAWAWGVITMKAALSTRPESEVRAREAQLERTVSEEIQNNRQLSGQTEYTKRAVYDGWFLDTRVSITYVGMGLIFIYCVYRLRAHVPKFALLAMFGGIVMNLFLTLAPLFPTFQGTLARILVLPSATAVGIGLVCNLLIFPESTSLVTLDGLVSLLKPMKPLLNAILINFEFPDAQFDLAKLQATRVAVLMAYKQMEANLAFLPLDLAVGRWSTEDVASLKAPFRQVVIHFNSLVSLQSHRIHASKRDKKFKELETELKKEQESDDSGSSQTLASKLPTVGVRQLALALDVRHKLYHPDSDDLLWKSLSVMFGQSGPIMQACGEALDAVMESITIVNARRWFKRPSAAECQELAAKHEVVLDNLKSQHDHFSATTTAKLLDPHLHLFGEDGKLLQTMKGNDAPVHGFLVGVLFQERIIGFADALIRLLTRIVELENTRTEVKVWPPTKLSQFGAWVLNKEDTPKPTETGEGMAHQELERARTNEVNLKQKKLSKRKQKKVKTGTQRQLEELRFHGGRSRKPASKFVIAVVKWLTCDESIFAFRAVIASLIFAIFANCTSTAGFFQREKGLWAIIMAQMSLAVYSAEFIFAFICRTLGTIAGGLLGLLAWYIGSADGPGSPYGISAIMAVVFVVLMWLRLFAPPQFMLATLLTGATCLITIGYSWDDTHIPSYGNPGVGYNVFWRRIVLVLAGVGAAAIVMCLPKPPSANRHNRHVLAGILRSHKDLYALFVAAWRHPHDGLLATAATECLRCASILGQQAPTLKLLKLEFTSSNFDAASLITINRLLQTISSALGQLFVFSSPLPEHLRTRLTKVSGVLDETLIGDVMATMTMVEQSLKTGDPLPAMMPVPLVARSLGLHRQLVRLYKGDDAVTKDMLLDENFRKYCVALGAYVQVLAATDELVIAVKEVCGETHVVDVESWPMLAGSDSD